MREKPLVARISLKFLHSTRRAYEAVEVSLYEHAVPTGKRTVISPL